MDWVEEHFARVARTWGLDADERPPRTLAGVCTGFARGLHGVCTGLHDLIRFLRLVSTNLDSKICTTPTTPTTPAMSSSQLSFAQAKSRLKSAYEASFAAASPPGAAPKEGLGPVWQGYTGADEQTAVKKAIMGSIVKTVGENPADPPDYWFTKPVPGAVNFSSPTNPKLHGTNGDGAEVSAKVSDIVSDRTYIILGCLAGGEAGKTIKIGGVNATLSAYPGLGDTEVGVKIGFADRQPMGIEAMVTAAGLTWRPWGAAPPEPAPVLTGVGIPTRGVATAAGYNCKGWTGPGARLRAAELEEAGLADAAGMVTAVALASFTAMVAGGRETMIGAAALALHVSTLPPPLAGGERRRRLRR